MRPGAERHVCLSAAPVPPGDVQALRLRELTRIVVGAAQRGHHRVPRLKRRPPEVGVLGDVPHPRHQDGPAPAQQLVHRLRHQLRVGADQCQLVGVGQQRPDAVGEEVGRGVVPRDDQAEHHRDQFPVGETVAVLRPDQLADQVVRRLGPAALDQRLRVVHERAERLPQLLLLERERVGPAQPDGAVGHRHPDELTDHRDGQRVGEQTQEVDDAVLGVFRQPVQEIVREPLDARTEGADTPCGERGRHQTAQPAVARPVVVEECVREIRDELLGEAEVPHRVDLHERRAARDRARIVREPGIGEHRPYALMASDDPHQRPVERAHGTGRCLLPHMRVHGVRVGKYVGRRMRVGRILLIADRLTTHGCPPSACGGTPDVDH